MSKIFLCTVTQNEYANIKEMTEDLSWCDGIVAVVHQPSNDGTFELLDERKKEGEIYKAPWMDLHYIGMTLVVQSPKIRPGDWIYMLDSQERVIPEFVNNLRQKINEYEQQGIGALLWGKPFLFRKTLGMTYEGNPHCFPQSLAGKIINVQNEKEVIWGENQVQLGQYMLNKKNFNNTVILHGAKYYFYPISNQTTMFYGQFGEQILLKHEQARQMFLLGLEFELKIKPTFDLFIDYIKNNIDNLPSPLIEYIEFEFPLKDAIRMLILGQTREEILQKRINWSFEHYLRTKDLKQENTSFVGIINKYRAAANLPLEK